MHAGVLLSPADRRIAARISREDFDTIFVHSLLFEDEVVIPDVYYYNSPFLLGHLQDSRAGRRTVLEAAIERGVVRTAVRQPASSYDEVLRYLQNGEVFGLLPAADANYVTGRLDQSHHGKQFDVVWPDGMATSYQEILERVLGARDAPGFGVAKVSDELWASTQEFRTEGLRLGRSIANQRQGNFGIRRADVLRALAVMTGAITRSGDATPSEERIAASAGDHAWPVARFIDWLDELYMANQSIRFGLQASTSSRHHEDLALVASALRLREDPTNLAHRTFEAEVDVPELARLVELDPDRFLSLRDEGRDWYASIRRFLESPTTLNRSSAERALEEFAARVRAETRHLRPRTNQVRAQAGVLGGAVAAAAADLTMYAVDGPPITALGSVVAGGYVLHSWLKRTPTDKVRIARSPDTGRSFVSVDPD